MHIGKSIQSLLALNVKDHGFSPSLIKVDFEIGIWWFSNKLTAVIIEQLITLWVFFGFFLALFFILIFSLAPMDRKIKSI